MRSVVRRVLLVSALLPALAVAGCASLFRSYDVAPNGLTRSDDALRRLLASGRADAAFDRVAPRHDAAPSDELLRLLYQGSIAHYASRFEESNLLLQRAADVAHDRMTMSLSRNAAAFITSDRALPYETGRTERLLVPYYAALNFLQLGDLGGATVEARRLSALLEADGGDRAAPDAALRAVLRYFAGTVFDAAGEGNDADVAYRNAAALGFTGSATPMPAGSGEVVIMLEHGFAAHLVESSFNVLLEGTEVEALTGGSAGDRAAIAGLVAARALTGGAQSTTAAAQPQRRPARSTPAPAVAPGRNAAGGPAAGAGASDSTSRREASASPYLMRVAWPTLRVPYRPTLSPRVVGASSDTLDAAFSFGDVSAGLRQDFDAALPLILARTIARTAAKLAISRGAERSLSERDEGAGRLLGVLGNAATALLEQADTRSWHLLPGEIGLARLQLPAGTHDLRIEVPGGMGRAPEVLQLGSVEVQAGRVTFLSARRW
jgi:uncharacterized protein